MESLSWFEEGGGNDSPRPPPLVGSVVDADEVFDPARTPCHLFEVEEGDHSLIAGLGDSRGAERRGNEVKYRGPRGGAGSSVNLVEGELDGSGCEAGAEDDGGFGGGHIGIVPFDCWVVKGVEQRAPPP